MNRPDLIAEAYHGTTTNYGYGCRCDECRAAHNKDQLERYSSHRGLPPDDPRHGTLNGYRNWRCACELCRAANTSDVMAAKANRRGSLAPDDPRHGTLNGYGNYGCRCPLCRAANASYGRRYRAES